MEEEKAAAYYDELTRKGGGAARFKHGLGFSSTSSNRDDLVPARGSALPFSSSSFLSSFVKASSPTKAAEFQKQAQLETIQNKLKKKPANASEIEQSSRVSRDNSRSISKERDRDRHSRQRSRSRSRSRDGRGSRNRHRSSSRDRDRDRYGERERDRERRKGGRRSRSRSVSDEDSHRMGQRDRGRRRSRSVSPRDRKPEKSGLSGGDWGKDKRMGKVGKERHGAIDYAKLIEGYEKMSQAEKVKAKMKLQLSETAEKDAAEGMGSGWERFEFNKDAPLDDEEIEAVEDDAALVKHIGQSFRFSAVETRREEQIKAAHDKAMFGASSIPPPVDTEDEVEQDNNKNESKESAHATSLISDKVISRQQGSWRDRARKL